MEYYRRLDILRVLAHLCRRVGIQVSDDVEIVFQRIKVDNHAGGVKLCQQRSNLWPVNAHVYLLEDQALRSALEVNSLAVTTSRSHIPDNFQCAVFSGMDEVIDIDAVADV